MPFDGSGNYTLPSGSTAVTGTTILAVTHNTPITDIGAALNQVMLRNGAAPMTGNLNMNANRVTGVAAAVASSDTPRFDQLTSDNTTVTPYGYFSATDLQGALEDLSDAIAGGGGGGGSVTSVFGRSGAVSAQSGDYNIGQISGAGSLAAKSSIALNSSDTSGILPLTKGGTGQNTALSAFAALANSAPVVDFTFDGSDVVLVYDSSASAWRRMGVSLFVQRAFAWTFGTTKGRILYANGSQWTTLSPP